MADQPGANPSIEELLEERHQIEVWLARLDSTSDTAPEAVRQRVRHDYERRMEAVTDELRAHADDIAEQLAECRIKQADLALREAESQDTMSEAEIRHAVGEYGEDEWQRLRSETHRTLVTVREELHRVNTEINRLVEVQALIAGPSTPEPDPAAPAPSLTPTLPPPPVEVPKLDVSPTPAPDPFSDEPPVEPEPLSAEPVPTSATPPPPTGAPRFVPRNAKAKESPPRTIPIGSDTPEPTPAPRETLGDELAFLKSVSEDERTGPSPRRATGTFSRAGRDPISLPSLEPEAEPPAQTSPPAAPPSPKTPPPAPPPSGPPSRPVLTTADPMANTGPTKGLGDRPSQQGAAKTLKCADCGGLNRPTEWYCERCGAELAAL